MSQISGKPSESNSSVEVTTSENELSQEALMEDQYKGVIFPALITRIKALFIDFIILLIIFSLASILIDQFDRVPTFVRIIIYLFSIYIYEPLFVTIFGGTIGHQIMKITIRKVDQPKIKINAGQAIIRLIIKYVLGWISFITLIGNKRKRGIHDLASGSVVLFNRDIETRELS